MKNGIEMLATASANQEKKNELGVVELTVEEARMTSGGEDWSPAPWYLDPRANDNPFIICHIPFRCVVY